MGNNLAFLYLVELLKRLKTKKPKFFVYLQSFVAILGAVTGIPALLENYGITLPPAATLLESKIVGIASVGFLIATQLTSQSNLNSISPQGVANKQTDPKNLPFTARVEVKTAIKQGKPTEIDPNQKN